MSMATAERILSDTGAEFNSELSTAFFRDVVKGLSATKKTLSAKYFYDDLGSKYFDEICHLDEYYLYKTELALLPVVARDMDEILCEDVDVVEFGAGSVHKIRPLLDSIEHIASFVPIDISGPHLQESCNVLREEFPEMDIQPVQGDFTQKINLPNRKFKNMGFFPGSTIGNFTHEEALSFLASAKDTLGNNARFLVGVDTKKSPEVLHKAYNDNKGVTAKFNLNILHRINRELGSNIDVDKFEHYAFYNATEGRVEMHLVSLEYQCYEFSGEEITFTPGESIHTENSYKYAPDEFRELAAEAGWGCEKKWISPNNAFSMFLLHS